MEQKTFFSKYFKSSEEIVSMFLGLVIVLVMVGMVANYFQRRRGTVEIPGLFDNKNKPSEQAAAITSGEEVKLIPGTNYRVKANDSLWKIAVATYGDGYAWTKIAKENKLKNPGILITNQELLLPIMEKTATKETEVKLEVKDANRSYTVVRADSLWKIAVATYGDGYAWTKIWNANRSKLYNPNKLEIGMALIIPSLK